MVIEIKLEDESRDFLLSEHAQMRLLTRSITKVVLQTGLASGYNPRGRQEYLHKGLKVVVEEDEAEYYDGIIITAHRI